MYLVFFQKSTPILSQFHIKSQLLKKTTKQNLRTNTNIYTPLLLE